MHAALNYGVLVDHIPLQAPTPTAHGFTLWKSRCRAAQFTDVLPYPKSCTILNLLSLRDNRTITATGYNAIFMGKHMRGTLKDPYHVAEGNASRCTFFDASHLSAQPPQ